MMQKYDGTIQGGIMETNLKMEEINVNEPTTERTAIIAFVLSVTGMITYGLTSGIGLIFGIAALKKIAAREHCDGRGLAITSIVINSVYTVVFGIVLLFYLPLIFLMG